jgi:glucokinase
MSQKLHLIADIGGTHIRLGLTKDIALRDLAHYEAESLEVAERYNATDFERFEDVIWAFLKSTQSDAEDIQSAAFASACRPQDGVITFDAGIKNNPMVIDEKQIADALGVADVSFVLDSHAQFYTVQSPYAHTLFEPIFEEGRKSEPFAPQTSLLKHIGPRKDDAPLLLISVGTGLGHSYGYDHNQVTPCFGGHSAPLCITQEQFDVMQYVKKDIEHKRSIIYEDLISGRGFLALYHYACHKKCAPPKHKTLQSLFASTEKQDRQLALYAGRLFCEFLGLYVHATATATHSFGGVVLIGALLRAIKSHGLWDAKAFKAMICGRMVKTVAQAWAELPLYMGRAPYFTLHGLIALLAERKKLK